MKNLKIVTAAVIAATVLPLAAMAKGDHHDRSSSYDRQYSSAVAHGQVSDEARHPASINASSIQGRNTTDYQTAQAPWAPESYVSNRWEPAYSDRNDRNDRNDRMSR